MASTRLGSILEQEYKSKGLISGTTSAIGKRAMESMDFRNVLFGGSGMGSIIGRKIFGKGYSATRGSSTGIGSTGVDLSSSGAALTEMNINAGITAKNSLVLPSMARDMHLVKQNIIKMVKLQGGTPTTKAGDWFQRQAARETAYESRFGVKTPTKIATPSGKTLEQNTSALTGLFGSLSTKLFPLIGISSMLGAALGGIVRVVFGVLRLVSRTKLGKLLGISAALLGANALAGNDSGDIGGDAEIFDFNKDYVDTSNTGGMDTLTKGIAVAEGVAGGAAGIAGARGLAKAAGATGTAILDARTMSVGQLAKSTPTSKWGHFLKWMAKRSPGLFAKVGLRLAQAGALMAIPIGGWIMALINLGFALWTAWDIYQLWKEYNNSADSESGTSPTRDTTTSDLTGGTLSSTSPMQSTGDGTGVTFNSLSKDEQERFLMNQAKAEGSLKPGSVGHRHNNPGNIIAKSPTEVYEAQAKFGGVPGETIKGPDGETRTFVKFPSMEQGLAAQRDLWQRKYGNMPIDQALNKWVNPSSSGEMASYSSTALAGIKASQPTMSNSGVNGGSALSAYSQDVASMQRNTGGNTYNVDNSTTNTNGNQNQNSGNVQVAEVFDSEFARLLSRMM